MPREIDPSLWSDVPREVAIDLSAVRSADAFERAIAAAFRLEADARSVWHSLSTSILYRTSPIHVTVTGWEPFARAMPRYARRLQQILRAPQRIERVLFT